VILNEAERLLLYLEAMTIHEFNKFFHIIAPEESKEQRTAIFTRSHFEGVERANRATGETATITIFDSENYKESQRTSTNSTSLSTSNASPAIKNTLSPFSKRLYLRPIIEETEPSSTPSQTNANNTPLSSQQTNLPIIEKSKAIQQIQNNNNNDNHTNVNDNENIKSDDILTVDSNENSACVVSKLPPEVPDSYVSSPAYTPELEAVLHKLSLIYFEAAAHFRVSISSFIHKSANDIILLLE
jgi:hypothetical protein